MILYLMKTIFYTLKNEIASMMEEKSLKKELIDLFSTLLDDFSHEEKEKISIKK